MAAKYMDVKVRPLSNASLEKGSLQGAARLYVSRDSFINLTGSVNQGPACTIEQLLDSADAVPIKREASLHMLTEKISANVAMMTRAFQDATGFKIGDRVRITLGDKVPDAEEVVVEEIEDKSDQETQMKYPPSWKSPISSALGRAEQVYPGMKLESIQVGPSRKAFRVVSVNSLKNNLARFIIATTSIRIQGSGDDTAPASDPSQRGELKIDHIPGLAPSVIITNKFLKGFTRPFYVKGERDSCGFVIQGSPGTGKTFILRKIESTQWGKTYWIKPSDKLSTVREVFKQATSQSPSLIFLDGLEELISKDRPNRESVIDTLAEELDSLSTEAEAKQALPQVVVIATCSDYLLDVPTKLQIPSRFRDKVELPLPRESERLEILSFLDPPLDPSERESMLADMASRSHAYNLYDLRTLLRNAKLTLVGRIDDIMEHTPELAHQQSVLTAGDIDQAFRLTRPTAMHDINLKPPTVHWEDIGGQEYLKKALMQMIKYTKDSSAYHCFLQDRPKGLLLYGPPGCSKTLCAQAMATESSFNFFAVKGAELLNMYVGESERAVRNLFTRARAASPAIIFFDEIDSIGGQRAPGGSSSGSSGSVNMLTALLTEMDGFESLTDVLVLAATNRPEAIDPALIRPGRFDQFLYVGPPDQDAREAIFKVRLRGLPLAEDVDTHKIASLADGYSGAEIKSICNAAGKTALMRWEEAGSKQEDLGPKSGIRMADLEESVRNQPRGITRDVIQGYERWSLQFAR